MKAVPTETIALWKPDPALLANSRKLDRAVYSIKFCFTDQPGTESFPGAATLPPSAVPSAGFDFLLIPFAGFKETKSILENEYHIEAGKLYTYEEFRVRNCEQEIVTKYHTFWRSLQSKDILPYHGKNVLITGGSSGIGRETALAFALAGAGVVITGRNPDKLEHTLTELSKELDGKGRVTSFVWDVTDFNGYRANLSALLRQQGRIDILINNAGIWQGGSFFDVTPEAFDSIIETDLKAVFFMCQLFASYFMEHTVHGHIINMISNVGSLPTVKPYGLAKWGVTGLTKGLGQHLAEYGITVNGIAPGAVATPLAGWTQGDCPARRNPRNGRVAFPCEIAQTALFLGGFMGENMPGEIIVSDGGDKAIGLNL